MPDAPEHLDESTCVWCGTKIVYWVEGVANETTGGHDVRTSCWRHLDVSGAPIDPDDEDALADFFGPDTGKDWDHEHEPTPPLGVWKEGTDATQG